MLKRTVLFLFMMVLLVGIYAQPFSAIVASDGSGTHTSVQAAVDACPDNVRSVIYIKNGTYNERVSIGAKGANSKKIISLIGESAEGVVITSSGFRNSNDPANTNTVYDIVTVQIYANDFYAENITIANTASKNETVGQAEALYTASDRHTFKNCSILGHQDTYKSNSAMRGYFKDCFIEGTVDFIYDGGVVFFDDCTINSVRGNGYITAPATGLTIPKTLTANAIFLRYGFFFRNCKLTANQGVVNNSFYLGRPWGERSGTFYINCKMGKHIRTEGWQAWNGNESTATFGEYNSMDENGASLNVSGRANWSMQLAQKDVETLMNPTYIYNLANSSVKYNPLELCTAPSSPSTVTKSNNTLTWSAVENAAGYAVFKDGTFHAATLLNTYTYTNEGKYSVRAVSKSGALSEEKGVESSVNSMKTQPGFTFSNGNVLISEASTIEVFSIAGKKVGSFNQPATTFNIQSYPIGVYIVKAKTLGGLKICKKLVINNSK